MRKAKTNPFRRKEEPTYGVVVRLGYPEIFKASLLVETFVAIFKQAVQRCSRENN